MLVRATVTSFLLSALPIIAQERDLEFGEFVSSNGTQISVEEDFMDGRYPRHVIVFEHQMATEREGRLLLRCESNRTEVFFASGSFDFFGAGQQYSVTVRFASEDAPREIPVSNSANNEAVFFPDPIDFAVGLVVSGSVGLSGRYFGGSFRHNVQLDRLTTLAIYDAAETCGWISRLPELEAPNLASMSETQISDPALIEGLEGLIEEFGLDQVKDAILNFE